MTKKAAPKTSAALAPKAPATPPKKTPKATPKAAAKPRKKVEPEKAVVVVMTAIKTTIPDPKAVLAARVLAASAKTETFDTVVVTINLAGGDGLRCDIRATRGPAIVAQSAASDNTIRPLLLEVLEKLKTAFPSQNFVTLGIDGNGGLVPTGKS